MLKLTQKLYRLQKITLTLTYLFVKVKVISVAKENKNQDNIGTNICGRIPTDDTEFEQTKKTKTEFKFILSFKLGFLS